MSMPTHGVSPAKAAVVAEMKEKLESAQGAVLVGFTGLTVADVTKLRRKFREGGVEYKVKAGLVDGQVIDAAAVNALADLPSREELIAKLLGSMQAPVSGLVNVLQGNIRNVVYALEAVRAKKAEQETA